MRVGTRARLSLLAHLAASPAAAVKAPLWFHANVVPCSQGLAFVLALAMAFSGRTPLRGPRRPVWPRTFFCRSCDCQGAAGSGPLGKEACHLHCTSLIVGHHGDCADWGNPNVTTTTSVAVPSCSCCLHVVCQGRQARGLSRLVTNSPHASVFGCCFRGDIPF
jgi:hypothetical protein